MNRRHIFIRPDWQIVKMADNAYVSIKPWNSLYDGYMSIAKEILDLIDKSNHFSKSEYEGREEFYHKYTDYYNMLMGVFEGY